MQCIRVITLVCTIPRQCRGATGMSTQHWSNSVYGSCNRILSGIYNAVDNFCRPKPRKKFTVAIEGNIGSGKTSLLQHFVNSSYAEVYQEPVRKWRDIDGVNGLALMYEDPSRWSLTFQTYVQLTMLETHKKKQLKPIKLMERSIYSAKYCFVENLYESGKMPEVEYIVLSRWFDWIIKNEDCTLDLIVYLQTKPETVYERIRQRCRNEERTIPLDYLTTLHDLHEDWLIHKTKFNVSCPVLVLDANKDIESMLGSYENHRSEILFGYS